MESVCNIHVQRGAVVRSSAAAIHDSSHRLHAIIVQLIKVTTEFRM